MWPGSGRGSDARLRGRGRAMTLKEVGGGVANDEQGPAAVPGQNSGRRFQLLCPGERKGNPSLIRC
jgi:hypothetical protein